MVFIDSNIYEMVMLCFLEQRETDILFSSSDADCHSHMVRHSSMYIHLFSRVIGLVLRTDPGTVYSLCPDLFFSAENKPKSSVALIRLDPGSVEMWHVAVAISLRFVFWVI